MAKKTIIKPGERCPECKRPWVAKYVGSTQCGICWFYANPDKQPFISPPRLGKEELELEDELATNQTHE